MAASRKGGPMGSVKAAAVLWEDPRSAQARHLIHAPLQATDFELKARRARLKRGG